MKDFLREQLYIGLSVLLFVVLFNKLSGVYNALFNSFEGLNNISEEQAITIEKVVQDQLGNPVISNKLQRSFVFFYLNNYNSRVLFTAKEGVTVANKEQIIDGDPFYELMLNYHLNDICFVRETININPESLVYNRFQETGELRPGFYYVSCPLYIEDTLIGYIGGINNNTEGSISVETSIVKNTATNIEQVLNRN